MDNNTELEKYKEQLERHDWFYERSDDMRSYDGGKFNHDKLVRLSKTNEEFKKAYDEVRNRKFENIEA